LSVLLVTPVFRRLDLTRIMLEHRVNTFEEASNLGVEAQCVCVGDFENIELARSLGFVGIEASNLLGAKYNDGHQYAVEHGFDFSFHCNSDQVFDARLLHAIDTSPIDMLIQTRWMTAVHDTGKKAIQYRNPLWAMKIYPTELLARNPRPCEENIMKMCDTSTHEGVLRANPGVDTLWLEVGPLETIQFESGFQVTPWKRHLWVAGLEKRGEVPVMWNEIWELHGPELVDTMQKFYGLRR
jgi:hypothetical protein